MIPSCIYAALSMSTKKKKEKKRKVCDNHKVSNPTFHWLNRSVGKHITIAPAGQWGIT